MKMYNQRYRAILKSTKILKSIVKLKNQEKNVKSLLKN